MKKLLLILLFTCLITPVAFATGMVVDQYEVITPVVDNDDAFTVVTNPVKNGKLQLRFDHISNPNVTISIINSLGNQVYARKASVVSKTINLDISDLASGIYFIRVNTTTSNLVKKLIVQ